MGFKIIGTGAGIPHKVVTNDDLAAMMDTSDEWISTRTGIRRRHVLSDGETLLDLAVNAAKNAIKNSGLPAEDIDAVIVTSVNGEYRTPSMSCLIAGILGIGEGRVTIDINAACCGFVAALNTANAYLTSGMAKTVLVVSAEALTRLVDWADRSTCVLFGDGAGAVVLQASDKEVYFDLKTENNDGWHHLVAGRCPDSSPFAPLPEGYDYYMHMDGQDIYKFAVSSITARIRSVMAKADCTADGVSSFLLHQANLRIIKGAVSRFGSEEKFPHNIENFGNTSSASIPILLSEISANLVRGDKIVMCAFGAGLSSAACLFEW